MATKGQEQPKTPPKAGTGKVVPPQQEKTPPKAGTGKVVPPRRQAGVGSTPELGGNPELGGVGGSTPKLGGVPGNMMPPPVPPRKFDVPPPVPPRKFDAKEDPLQKLAEQMPQPQTLAGQLLAEVNKKTGQSGEERGPHGRGARPERPAQIRRETGRSFERLAEKLNEKVEALATCQAELNLCQHNLDAATAEQKRLATRNEELQKANDNLVSQYQGMLQAMGPLTQSSADASQWKSAWYASEETRRSLQTQLEEQSTKHAAVMESMAREIKDNAEERRASLIRTHVTAQKEKDNRITELTQELLQMREQMEAMEKADLR